MREIKTSFQYPPAPGADSPSLFKAKRISLNLFKSFFDWVVVLDLESSNSTVEQILSQVVPWAKASVLAVLNAASCSLDKYYKCQLKLR